MPLHMGEVVNQGFSPICRRISTNIHKYLRIRGKPGIANIYEYLQILAMRDMGILSI